MDRARAGRVGARCSRRRASWSTSPPRSRRASPDAAIFGWGVCATLAALVLELARAAPRRGRAYAEAALSKPTGRTRALGPAITSLARVVSRALAKHRSSPEGVRVRVRSSMRALAVRAGRDFENLTSELVRLDPGVGRRRRRRVAPPRTRSAPRRGGARYLPSMVEHAATGVTRVRSRGAAARASGVDARPDTGSSALAEDAGRAVGRRGKTPSPTPLEAAVETNDAPLGSRRPTRDPRSRGAIPGHEGRRRGSSRGFTAAPKARRVGGPSGRKPHRPRTRRTRAPGIAGPGRCALADAVILATTRSSTTTVLGLRRGPRFFFSHRDREGPHDGTRYATREPRAASLCAAEGGYRQHHGHERRNPRGTRWWWMAADPYRPLVARRTARV